MSSRLEDEGCRLGGEGWGVSVWWPRISVVPGGRMAGCTMSSMDWPVGACRPCTWVMAAARRFSEKKAEPREVMGAGRSAFSAPFCSMPPCHHHCRGYPRHGCSQVRLVMPERVQVVGGSL